jgi:hypothetical protein
MNSVNARSVPDGQELKISGIVTKRNADAFTCVRLTARRPSCRLRIEHGSRPSAKDCSAQTNLPE